MSIDSINPELKPMYETIIYEEIGPIARIFHNRPNSRNAENMQLLDELDDAVKKASENNAIRVLIIAGKGSHFSAGHDLKEGQAVRSTYTVEQRWAYEQQRYYRYCMNILDFPKPTIAQVNGACISGGFMLANMCDLLVASDDAYFADPVIHTIATAAVEVLIHPWVLGMRKAKELLFTGGRLSADEAHRVGMVNRVVPLDQLEAETLALANRIAEAPPFATQLTKKSLNRTMDIQGLRSALSAHFDTHLLTHYSEEFRSAREVGLHNAIKKGKDRAASVPAST
jgi:enoyl-CoA hydratase